MIRGLIFDLDGVIVNTDIYHFEAWKQVASQYSIHLDSSINERLKGLSRRDSWNLIMELGNIQLSDEETNLVLETKNSLYRKELKNLSRDNILLGVEDFLQELNQKNFKLAIGSSSKNARDILQYLNLSSSFNSIIDGSMVKNLKPSPDIFILAAKTLDLETNQCLVFEDALSGVQAAKAGGFKVVAVGNKELLDLADYHIDNFLNFKIDEYATVS
ncbi:MAG: beta-phosphoglucomutase [Bacteroidota bacterium]|nr:beta-phosphoglucomutase [Bacteroidota bacterium]